MSNTVNEQNDSPDSLTRERIEEIIRDTFKDSEKSLKYFDSIIDNLLELKKLEVNNPKSTSFMTWIMPILLLFTGFWSSDQKK